MAVKSVQAIINGQTYTLNLNTSTGKYEATITAPGVSSYPKDGHYYPVTITATDDAGNSTTINDTDTALGSKLQLKVKEKVAPIITINYPTASAVIINNKPAIAFKVIDSDSGVDPATIQITIGSTVISSGITKNPISGGYDCTYTPSTPLSDGMNTVKVDATDFDGNIAAQKSVTFKVDTVPPVLSINSPVDGLITNKSGCTVDGLTNDATSSPVTVTIKLNGGAAEAVTVGQDGTFRKNISLVDGINTIVIVATDSAGKITTVTRTVELDTVAPTITDVVLAPNPVDAGKTYVITVTVK